MLKKVLFISGLTAIGGAFYYYFKKQLDLALNFDYKLKDLKFLELDTKGATISTTVQITNKSSFQVEVLDYNVNFSYGKYNIASTKSTNTFVIMPDSSFNISAIGNIDFTKVKDALLPFVNNVIKKKPVSMNVDGYVQVKFLGIVRTIRFDNDKVAYSENLLKETGLDDDVDKIKGKVNDILSIVGIKL